MKKIFFFLACCLMMATTNAQITLNLKCFIQGYYDIVNHNMVEALTNQGCTGAGSNIATLISIELHSDSSPYGVVAYGSAPDRALNTTGSVNITFTGIAPSSIYHYYIVVKHRNTLETWSASTVTFPSSTAVSYDFSTGKTQAHGSNEEIVEAGVYALLSGDINQNGIINAADNDLLDADVQGFAYGCLDPDTDINGDGYVDLIDTALIEDNVANEVEVSHP